MKLENKFLFVDLIIVCKRKVLFKAQYALLDCSDWCDETVCPMRHCNSFVNILSFSQTYIENTFNIM